MNSGRPVGPMNTAESVGLVLNYLGVALLIISVFTLVIICVMWVLNKKSKKNIQTQKRYRIILAVSLITVVVSFFFLINPWSPYKVI